MNQMTRRRIPLIPSKNAMNHTPSKRLSIIELLDDQVTTLAAEKASILLKYETSNNTINPTTRHNFKHYYWSCDCYTHWGHNCKKTQDISNTTTDLEIVALIGGVTVKTKNRTYWKCWLQGLGWMPNKYWLLRAAGLVRLKN